MSSLKDLLSQIEALQNQVAEVRQREVGEAVAKVRAIVAEYQLTANDVFPTGKGKSSAKKTGKVAAKYRDPLSGNGRPERKNGAWRGRFLCAPPSLLSTTCVFQLGGDIPDPGIVVNSRAVYLIRV